MGELLSLTDAADTIDRSRAITDVHSTFAIECQSGSYPQRGGKGHRFMKWRQTIDRPIHPAGHKHLTATIKGDSRRISDVAGNFTHFAINVNAEQSHRQS